MKKILKVMCLILLIIFMILILYYIVIHFNGFLDKSNSMTRNEVIALLEKGKEYSNYYYCSQDVGLSGFFLNKIDKNKTEHYIKDNIVKVVVDGKIVRWENYNTNEIINIMGERDGKNYAAIISATEYYKDDDNYNQMGFDYSLVSNEELFNTDYEYMGMKKVDNRDTILVKVWNKKSAKVFNSTIFYVDEITGLITKRIDYNTLGLIKIETDRNVKLDSVLDADIEKPNLDGYEILNK